MIDNLTCKNCGRIIKEEHSQFSIFFCSDPCHSCYVYNILEDKKYILTPFQQRLSSLYEKIKSIEKLKKDYEEKIRELENNKEIEKLNEMIKVENIITIDEVNNLDLNKTCCKIYRELCHNCGSINTIKHGTNTGVQQYYCKKCKKFFR